MIGGHDIHTWCPYVRLYDRPSGKQNNATRRKQKHATTLHGAWWVTLKSPDLFHLYLSRSNCCWFFIVNLWDYVVYVGVTIVVILDTIWPPSVQRIRCPNDVTIASKKITSLKTVQHCHQRRRKHRNHRHLDTQCICLIFNQKPKIIWKSYKEQFKWKL